jgi:hypothetical protein
MNQLLLILLSMISIAGYSQSEILNSIKKVQSTNDHELAIKFCTEGYWNATSDGGINTFRQIADWPKKLELKLFKEQRNKKRAVLTVDLYYKGIPEERVFLFLVKESGRWLLDGFNEVEDLSDHFLEAYYTGHFTPFDLPRDDKLNEFGMKILSYVNNSERLIKFLEDETEVGSSFNFVDELTQEADLKPYFVNMYGFDERINKGYINFWANPKNEGDDNNGNITIYVSKTENGKLKILGQGLYGPSINDFFSIK